MRKWYLIFNFHAVVNLHHTVEASSTFTAIVKARQELIECGLWDDILDQNMSSITITGGEIIAGL